MSSVVDLIKEKPFFVPKILLSNYRELGISDEELIIIMVIMNKGDKVIYDPEMFANSINAD